MVALNIPTFAGMMPALDDHLLSENNAAEAVNVLLYSGALEGLPKYTSIHNMVRQTAGVAFRIPINEEDPLYLANSYWLEFDDPNTDFLRAPVANDMYKRYYFASKSVSPRYNTRDRIIAGQPAFLLGLPNPPAITVSATGGASSTLVSRAYVSTYVTAYGEEGPVSPAVTINGKVDATYTVTQPGVINPNDLGVNRNIVSVNVYRTVVAADGGVDYYLVKNIPAQTASQNFSDTVLDTNLASNNPLRSTAWSGPPSDMQGLAAMPNGILAGFRGNELWFSEAYRPHAWPAAYTLSLDYNIVGLGVTNQTLVVLTEGTPMTASGVNPASISTSRVATFEPCISRGSIVSSADGVYYASPNGLILVNPGIAQNVTEQVISREEWLKLLTVKQIRAGKFGTAYFAFSGGTPISIQQNAFQQDAFQQASVTLQGNSGFMVNPKNANAGISLLTANTLITSVENDNLSGEMLVTFDGKVQWLDQNVGHLKQPYRWLSKIFQTPEPVNFAACKAYFYEKDYPNPELLGTPNHDLVQTYDPEHQIAIVRIFADGKHVATRELRTPGQLLRLPSGYKADFWQIEIEGVVRFKSFQMATSVKELKSV